MTEKEYRFHRLKMSGKLNEKRIVLYGTGKNAEYIITNAPEADIVGLMDEKQTGRFFWGKEVLSRYQILELRPDIIIMAAEHAAAQEIYRRIRSFCRQYQIELADMYGEDVFVLRQRLKEQTVDGAAGPVRIAMETAKHDLICFELFGMLCDIKANQEELWKKVSAEESFLINRRFAEDRISCDKKTYSLEDIYFFYQYLPGMNPELSRQLQERETKVLLEAVVPRPEMVSLVNDAHQKGKHVMIYVANRILPLAEVPRLLLSLGIYGYHDILQEEGGMTLTNGLLRRELERHPGKKLLYIGNDQNDGPIMPLIYHQDVLVIKNSDKSDEIPEATTISKKEKTVLFISFRMPRFDRDAGSRTIFRYMKLFVKQGYSVKFLPSNFRGEEPYTWLCEQEGIEVLHGSKYQEDIQNWFIEHQHEIGYAFLNYPTGSLAFLNILLKTTIKIIYFGHDLHFWRLQREYQLKNDSRIKEKAEKHFTIEKELIEKSAVVYYPSDAEVRLIKEIMHTDKAKAIKLLFYDKVPESSNYRPEQRKDLLFVGGFSHQPNVDAVLWFVRDVYPAIYEKEKIKLIIVGSDMPLEITQINHPGVENKGFLRDEELDLLYQQIKMAVIPVRFGAGVKGKVLDAMYKGIPMVTTTIGAEGINRADRVLRIEDEPSRFAEAVLEMYGDRELLRKTSQQYIECIRKYYSEEAAWNVIKDDFT